MTGATTPSTLSELWNLKAFHMNHVTSTSKCFILPFRVEATKFRILFYSPRIIESTGVAASAGCNTLGASAEIFAHSNRRM